MNQSNTANLQKMFLENMPEPSDLLRSAVYGNSDTTIAVETARRLKLEGKDTFNFGDIRRIQNEMFTGSATKGNKG